jgi:DNA-binding HxlR family transcriptional regulator
MDQLPGELDFNKDCLPSMKAIEDALYVLGGKWKLKIIVALFSGNRRFNDLQKAVGGISARILSNELKALELNGFVNRKVHNGAPVNVEYQLTAYSRTLKTIVHALEDWGANHRQKLKER